MGIIKTHKKNNFTIVDNKILTSPVLTPKARIILAFCLGLPDGWNFVQWDIAKRLHITIDLLRAGLVELETTGHLIRNGKRIKDEHGKFTDKTNYDFYETDYRTEFNESKVQ